MAQPLQNDDSRRVQCPEDIAAIAVELNIPFQQMDVGLSRQMLVSIVGRRLKDILILTTGERQQQEYPEAAADAVLEYGNQVKPIKWNQQSIASLTASIRGLNDKTCYICCEFALHGVAPKCNECVSAVCVRCMFGLVFGMNDETNWRTNRDITCYCWNKKCY